MKAAVTIENEMDFFSQYPLKLDPIKKDVLANVENQTVCFEIKSCSFDIHGALNLIEFLNQRAFHYIVRVPGKVGSFGTVLCLGAEEIQISSFGSLASIDPTFPLHGFPLVNSAGQPWHFNPFEFEPWMQNVNEVFSDADETVKSFVQCSLDNVFPKQSRKESKEYLENLQKKLILICNRRYPVEIKEKVVRFFLEELGSFDACAYFSQLKKIGLAASLYPIDVI